MATFVGFEIQHPQGGVINSYLTNAYHQFEAELWPPQSELVLRFKHGTMFKMVPVETSPRNKVGVAPKSYLNDFYERIHILPTHVNVGNLTSSQFVTVEVFNGYLQQKTLDNISASNAGGIQLTGDAPPSLYEPLSRGFYELAITTDGPPDINADFMFQWDSPIDEGHLYVLGSRIVMIPYIFESPMQETLEWQTQLFKSNNGSEQRVRLRKFPRQQLQARYPVPYAELARAEHLAYGWITRRWAVPMWNEAQQLQTTLATGVQTFNIDTTKADFRLGSLVSIWQDARTNITAEIQALTPTSITLDKPLVDPYIMPWICPVRIGRVLGNITRQTDGYNGALNIKFEFSDGVDLGAGAAPTQYLGHDIYFEPGVIGDEKYLQDQINARIDVVDHGGVVTTYSPWKNTQIRRTYKVVLQGLQEIWQFRKWLHRRAGRIRPFWMPTFESNLHMRQTGLVTGNLTVEADGYKLFANKRKHLAIKLHNGSYLMREVMDITDISQNRTLISVDPVLNVDASLIREISFVGLHRIDSDRIEINWTSNVTAQISVPIMEIEP